MDELKTKWAEHDRRLDAVISLNRQLLARFELKPARSAMGLLTFSLFFEVLIMLITVMLLGRFIGDHIGARKFVVPAALLDAAAIAFLINLVRQIVITRQIDFGRPIAAIQKKIETLRVLRIRYAQGLLLIAVLAWPPLLIVLFKGAFGLDAYALFGSAYIWANALVGLAVIPLAIWLSKRIDTHASESPVMRRLIRTINGSSLNAAIDSLAKLADFENETPR
ncbi:MAG TPA: hypothetical protein VIG32_12305 [Candidatus Baltobacteraceae bacterium]